MYMYINIIYSLNMYLLATTIVLQDVLHVKDNKQKSKQCTRVSIACHDKNDCRIILDP